MGSYDCNCMLTGVGLDRGDATAVILRRVADGYVPVGLGVAGSYDGFGTIDGIEEDGNTGRILRYFLDRAADRRFVARDQTSVLDGDALEADSDIEELLRIIERTNGALDDDLYAPSTTLDGDVIAFALIAQPVWAAIVGSVPEQPPEGPFAQWYDQSPTAREIYGNPPAELAAAVTHLMAVDDVVRRHGLRWAPPSEPAQRYATAYGGQHDNDEIREFLAQARQDYRDDPVILAGLDAYAELLDPEEPRDNAAEVSVTETYDWLEELSVAEAVVLIDDDGAESRER